jgi:hypothetical protein
MMYYISQFFYIFFTTKAGIWMKTRQKRRARNWQSEGSIWFGKNRRGNDDIWDQNVEENTKSS